jgi:hypothetical protein
VRDAENRHWRAANLSFTHHGDGAEAKSIGRIEELPAAGDEAGAAVWLENVVPSGALR